LNWISAGNRQLMVKETYLIARLRKISQPVNASPDRRGLEDTMILEPSLQLRVNLSANQNSDGSELGTTPRAPAGSSPPPMVVARSFVPECLAASVQSKLNQECADGRPQTVGCRALRQEL
jgi:hypothetical protein